MPHRAWNKTPIDEQELVTSYQQDIVSVRRLAQKYGVTVQTIYFRLKMLGVERRHGSDAVRGLNKGPANGNWRGGRTHAKDGKPIIRVEGKQVIESRVVAETILGRPLLAREVVHHKNGNNQDNSPDNLLVLPSQSEHMQLHMTSDRARKMALKLGEQRRLAALRAKGVGQ